MYAQVLSAVNSNRKEEDFIVNIYRKEQKIDTINAHAPMGTFDALMNTFSTTRPRSVLPGLRSMFVKHCDPKTIKAALNSVSCNHDTGR